MNLKIEPYQGHWLSLGVLVVGILLRFLYLDADPYYYEWVGYITDEGRWVQHARSWALDTPVESYYDNLHFFLAPLFQFSNYVVFELIGVRVLTARIFTALCGSAMLVMFWGMLRHTVSAPALLLGVTLLAVQTDLLALSRVAVPEMVVAFFQLLIYFVIVSKGNSSWHIVSAGLLLLVTCGMKATMILFLPIFSVIILLMPRRPTETQRWRDLALFLAGFGIPVLVTAFVGYSLFLERGPMFLDALRVWWVIRGFIAPADLYVYNVISFPFENVLAPTFNLWSLGLWLSLLGWLAVERDKIDFQSHRYLTTSAVWLMLYLFLMLSLEYFPTRYKVQVLLPMALTTTVGISLVQGLGIRKIIDAITESKGRAGLLWATVVSFPTAVFLAPLIASAVPLAGIDSERVGIKLACVLLLLAALTYLTQRLKRSRQAVAFLLIFPLVEGLVWTLLSTLVSAHVFWPKAELRFYTVSFSLQILGATVLSAIFAKAVDRWGNAESSRFIIGFVIVYLSILFVRIAPAYINPHYTMRDASRDLGNILSGYSTIATMRAEGLFNENNLRYRSFVNWTVENPQILVVAFRDVERIDILKRNYDLVKSYKIFVSPDYHHEGKKFVLHSTEGVTVAVYKKNGE